MSVDPAVAATLVPYTRATVRMHGAAAASDAPRGGNVSYAGERGGDDGQGHGGGEGAAGEPTDTCVHALDGWCDAPPFCEVLSDCSDCGECSASAYVVPVQITLNGRDGQLLVDGDGDEEGWPPDGAANVRRTRFTYYPLPRVRALHPIASFAAGGTLVTIHADGLDAFGDLRTTKCRFGGVTVGALDKGRGQVVCRAPAAALALPGDGGSVDTDAAAEAAADGAPSAGANRTTPGAVGLAQVWLTLNDQSYQRVGELYYYNAELFALRPSGGPAGGGTLLTLAGHGFVAATAAPGAPADPLTLARCRFSYAPPSDSGVHLAGVGAASYLGGGLDGLATPFPPAWVAEVPVLSLSNHELRCMAPAAPRGFRGRATIALTFDGGQNYLDARGAAVVYEYYRVQLHTVSPRGGPAAGGTAVVVSGEFGGFGALSEVLCRFGDEANGRVVRATLRTNSTVVCTTPSTCDPLGSTGTACTAGERITPPTLRTAALVGGQQVRLVPSAATTPAWASAAVAISLNGADWAGGAAQQEGEAEGHGLRFIFFALPTLTAVVPTGGPVGVEGATAVVRGSGLDALSQGLGAPADEPAQVWCRFGAPATALAVPALSHNETAVTCPLPVDHGAGSVAVAISLNGVDWLGTPTPAGAWDAAYGEAGFDYSLGRQRGSPNGATLTYTFFAAPVLRAMFPLVAHASGGLPITLHGARFDAVRPPSRPCPPVAAPPATSPRNHQPPTPLPAVWRALAGALSLRRLRGGGNHQDGDRARLPRPGLFTPTASRATC